MRSRCETLRERALRTGLNGKAALPWRIHCRSCPNCRKELYLLETLERQAVNERRHLGRSELAALLATAQEQHKSPRPLQSVRAWSLRLACLCVLIVAASKFNRNVTHDPISASGHERLASAPSSNARHMPLAPANIRSASQKKSNPPDTNIFSWPSTFSSEDDIQKRLSMLRHQVNVRRRVLIKITDSEYREDADDILPGFK